ncbi:hypothetical protein C3941_10235 [Kaistia algarum]|uniref:DUF2231 domain-containing protein n=1 Tax=Kaistia algarum TaxID=2083279 RepID=UPI000CE8C08F|nr:DUF2231 domain-containing protein [Kaistia algarum]MCX5512437.1 hypothetical protein [Kaistia algarum]PPE80516.1 hypothetical protein C3941_10235 [Kaistia algarum]
MVPVQHIHPMLVHFPIVLIFLLAGFDLVATLLGYSVTGRTATGNVSVGLAVLAALAALATYYFGGLALDYAEAGGFSSDVAEVHESLGGMVAIALTVWAVIRAALWFKDVRLTRPVAFLFPLVAIAGAALVVVTASYGGRLVFDLGVNVAKAASGG